MAVNKVVINNETQLDLTADTVDAAHLAKGFTAHDMKGESIVGTMESAQVTKPYVEYTLTSDGKKYKSINIHGNGTQTVFPGMIGDYIYATDIAISGVTEIPEKFMFDLSLTENLIIGDGVEKIGKEAFTINNNVPNCNSIIFSDSVKEIGMNSFNHWSAFTKVNFIFGKNLETMRGDSFIFRKQTFDFRKAEKIPVMTSSPVNSTSSSANFTIIVPDALYDAWRDNTNWSYFKNNYAEWKKASEVTA